LEFVILAIATTLPIQLKELSTAIYMETTETVKFKISSGSTSCCWKYRATLMTTVPIQSHIDTYDEPLRQSATALSLYVGLTQKPNGCSKTYMLY